MDFLLWYQESAIGEAVRTTLWVYPWVNAFHSVGMGFLVGVLAMISLRILGFGQFPLASLRKYTFVVKIAVGLNLVTGLMLFAGDATGFFSSPTFRVKALLVVLGGVTAWLMVKRAFSDELRGDGASPQAIKAIAAASLVFWVGAIFAGRMTAYLP